MTRFVDTYLPDTIPGYPAEVAPMFSTQLTQVDSGDEEANQRWTHALRSVSIPSGVRDHDSFEALKDHWLVMAGPARTFPFRDPTDFASAPLATVNTTPVIAFDDCSIGVGDGVTKDFQLTKRYTRGSTTYDRVINFPIVSSVLIGMAEPASPAHIASPSLFSPALTWTVTRYGGVVSFNIAPEEGVLISAGFLFDIQVRFEADDTFRGIMRTFGVSGFADIPLQEVRYCQD